MFFTRFLDGTTKMMKKLTTKKQPSGSNTFPLIYEYNDFRGYLEDYYQVCHLKDKRFNRSSFSKLLGLPNTRSFFGDVVRGKKISEAFTERFINVLGLDQDESNYFRALVRHNQSNNPDERQILFEQLISLNKVQRKIINKNVFEYYRNWYNGAIRAILDYVDFIDDYAGLAKRLIPSVSVREVKEAISLLQELKLIAPDSKGFLKPAEKSITASEYIQDEMVKQYQIMCADLSRRAIVTKFDQPHLFATNTFSISSEGLKTVENLVNRFRSELRACANRDSNKAEITYQLNLFLFPCSQKE
jgi:uncharacterized protein (TIGR02147 family)